MTNTLKLALFAAVGAMLIGNVLSYKTVSPAPSEVAAVASPASQAKPAPASASGKAPSRGGGFFEGMEFRRGSSANEPKANLAVEAPGGK